MDGDVEDIAVLESLKEYLRLVCPAVLNISAYFIETQLEKVDSAQSLRQFIAGPDVMALFAVKPDSEVDPDTGNWDLFNVDVLADRVFDICHVQRLFYFNLGFSQFDPYRLLLL